MAELSFKHTADISETELLETFGEDVFNILLRDHSTYAAIGKGKKGDEDKYHIIWATNDYSELGFGYKENDQITKEKVTGKRDFVVRPRASKSREQQKLRTQNKAEVFTPSWVCNAQNNLIDEAWFGKANVFNIVKEDNTWDSTSEKIEFPEGKTWQDYVSDLRIEITCGEAPYLCSRYDTTTCEFIELPDRIGLFDRKMRVVSENCDDEKEWLDAARKALQCTYGYEWQGDSLLIARESLFVSLIEYYQAKFGEEKMPNKEELKMFAYIISWNLWQMDGLKMVVPNSCHEERQQAQLTLFDDIVEEPKVTQCKGCETGDMHKHNGIYCLIREWGAWGTKEAGKKIKFIDTLNARK